MNENNISNDNNLELATLGAGCFWCVEAVFQQVEGVISVESGYSGGFFTNPTYDDVCNRETGHAEVCQIRFNPEIISYEKLLEIFWKTHDPTTINRQGNDIGSQYRSIIFFHNEKQKELAEKYKDELNKLGIFKKTIVTEIKQFERFYKAEEYHQNYYKQNKLKPYCSFIIKPKLDKFNLVFADIKKS